MAAGQAIGEVAVAQEPGGNFGSLDASGIPDSSLNTYRAMEVRRGSLTIGSTPRLPLDSQRAGPYMRPDEPDTIWSAGAPLPRRTGSITITVPMRGLVTAGQYTQYNVGGTPHPVGLLNNSGFAGYTPNDDVDPVAGAVGANEFTPTVVGDYTLGQIIGVEVAGARRFSCVTEITANIIHSPALALAAGNVYPCHTWAPAISGLGTGLGRSISMRFRRLHPVLGARQTFAYGGRVRKVTFRPDGERRHLMADYEIDFANVRDEGATVPGEPIIDEGASVANALGSEVCVSGPITLPYTGGVGLQLSRTTLEAAADWTFEIENTLAGVETHGAGPLAVSEWEVVQSIARATLRVTPVALLDTMLTTRERRQLLIGCGPGRAGSGWCGVIQAAHLTEDSLLDDTGDRITQTATFTGDYWDGDDSRVDPAGAPWKFGMPVV